jgi:hypothetical protein
MAVEFDGPTKRIIVQAGTDILDIPDMYSRWVDWLLTGDNSKYPLAISYVGGNPTVPGQSMTPYFFLENGWKIDACCEFEGVTHELDVTGIILSADGSNPWWMDPEMPMSMIRSIVPIRTETIATGGAEVDVPAIVNGVLNTPNSIDTNKDLGSSVRSLLTLLALLSSSSDQGIKITDLFRRFGLDPAVPVIHSELEIVAGDIDIHITPNPDGTYTKRRQ